MIPLVDLKAQYSSIKPELDAAVLHVLASGSYIMGQEVANFEEEFAPWVGGGSVVAMNSGTSALHLALLAAGIGPGDEVITVPMTFIATVSAIAYTGARPVFVDVDEATWTINPREVEAAITRRTKAIVPVHLHGRVAEMDPILAIARRHKVMVIEDARRHTERSTATVRREASATSHASLSTPVRTLARLEKQVLQSHPTVISLSACAC